MTEAQKQNRDEMKATKNKLKNYTIINGVATLICTIIAVECAKEGNKEGALFNAIFAGANLYCTRENYSSYKRASEICEAAGIN
jgi:hypothetical protein